MLADFGCIHRSRFATAVGVTEAGNPANSPHIYVFPGSGQTAYDGSGDLWTSGVDHLAGETTETLGDYGPDSSHNDTDNRQPFVVVGKIERYE